MKMSQISLTTLSIILILSTFIPTTNSFAIGLDLGTEFFKIVLVKPGTPFTIVENIQTKRKTPTAVSLKDDDRSYGSDALNKKIRLPQQVFVYIHEFLGKKLDDPELRQFLEDYFMSYILEEDPERKSITFKLRYSNKDFKFHTEEILAMIFRYVRFLSSRFAKADIKDVVVTVPNFFSFKQRFMLVQSAKIAGFTVLGLVNENVAAAVQYGIERRFNKTENILFYNMGTSYTQATLVNFQQKQLTTSGNKTIDYNSVTVLGETWDKNLGGRNFDYNLVRHLMKLFDNLPARKGKNSVAKNFKIAEKMLPVAIGAKEVLSSNKDALVTVLTVEDNVNLQDKISKDTFEKLSKKDFDRVFPPIEKLLKMTNFDINDITQVELIGGSIRIPKIQEILREYLGENKIGTHMNGDESSAFGAAFLAANSSSNFRARKMELNHGVNYELSLKFKSFVSDEISKFCDDDLELALGCVRSLDKEALLFRIRHGLDITKVISLKHDSDLTVEVRERFEEDKESKLILSYNVTGVHRLLRNVVEKEELNPLSPKIALKFKIDRLGLLDLKAELVYNITTYLKLTSDENGNHKISYETKKVEPLSEEEINKEIKIAAGSKLNETYVRQIRRNVGEIKFEEIRKDLKIHKDEVYPLSIIDLEKSKQSLDELDRIDQLRVETMERRNFLESFLYEKKEYLDSTEAKKYSSVEQRKQASDILTQVKDWFEEEGYTAKLETIVEKIKLVTEPIYAIEKRAQKHKSYLQTVDKFGKELDKTSTNAKNLLSTKPWVKDLYHNNFIKIYKETKQWYTVNKKKQDGLKLYEELVLTSEMLDVKLEAIQKEYKTMSSMRKPKPANETNKATKKTNDKKIDDIDYAKIQDMIKNKDDENEKIKEMIKNNPELKKILEEKQKETLKDQDL